MAYTGRLRPKGTFFTRQVYERVGISRAEIYERGTICQWKVYERGTFSAKHGIKCQGSDLGV